jgi:hypothetical protein
MTAEINKLVWGPPAPKTPVGKMDPEAFTPTADVARRFGVIRRLAADTHEARDLARTLK